MRRWQGLWSEDPDMPSAPPNPDGALTNVQLLLADPLLLDAVGDNPCRQSEADNCNDAHKAIP